MFISANLQEFNQKILFYNSVVFIWWISIKNLLISNSYLIRKSFANRALTFLHGGSNLKLRYSPFKLNFLVSAGCYDFGPNLICFPSFPCSWFPPGYYVVELLTFDPLYTHLVTPCALIVRVNTNLQTIELTNCPVQYVRGIQRAFEI